jgi:hypothetical protein
MSRGYHRKCWKALPSTCFRSLQRISWASRQTTTRLEDNTYCLLGVLRINKSRPFCMESEKKDFSVAVTYHSGITADQSLYAWKDPSAPHRKEAGILASSPR